MIYLIILLLASAICLLVGYMIGATYEIKAIRREDKTDDHDDYDEYDGKR